MKTLLVLTLALVPVLGPAPHAQPFCRPLAYDSSQDADPAYWQTWDALHANGWTPAGVLEQLKAPGCV